MDLLVIIDLQNDFVSGKLGTKEAQDIVPKIVKFAKKFDGDVVCTQDTHYKDTYADSIEGKKIPFHCEFYTKGWNIVPKLEKIRTISLYKQTFGYNIYNEMIRMFGKKYDNIYLCGVCTDICVLNTALYTLNSDVKSITVLSNLCAGTTPENHKKALDILKTNCINVEEV